MQSARIIIRLLFLAAISLFFSTGSAFSADIIAGTVWNGTTDKPAAGDDIALLTIDHGSLEVSRSKTAPDGSFRLRTNVSAPHWLRVRHDGVIYQLAVKSGDAPRINVFNAVSKADTVHGDVTMMKMETSKNLLRVTELHEITNNSNPPMTVVNSHNLEILLPEKAVLDLVLVSAPSQHPERVTPKPVAKGSKTYAVGYPLHPGATQFAISYHLPYSEKLALHPRLQYPTKLWTAVFPHSMAFEAMGQSPFNRLPDQNGMQVQALNGASAGTVPGFVISGSGALPHAQPANSVLKLPMLSQSAHFQPTTQAASARDTSVRSSKMLLLWGALGAFVMAVLFSTLVIRTRRTFGQNIEPAERQKAA